MNSLVLENKDGEVIRYLKPSAEEFYLIRQNKTKRLEAVAELSALPENTYEVLQKIKTSDLADTPYEVTKQTKLRLLPLIADVSLSPHEADESNKNLKNIFVLVAI